MGEKSFSGVSKNVFNTVASLYVSVIVPPLAKPWPSVAPYPLC